MFVLPLLHFVCFVCLLACLFVSLFFFFLVCFVLLVLFFQNVPAGAAPPQRQGGVDWSDGAAVHGGDKSCLVLPCLALPCLA